MIEADTYMVSVCITTYNMERYIARAIDSVLNQKVKFAVEILVSDDASSDKTIDIVKDYQNKYPDKIFLLTADENKGLISNFVKAINAARGKYIAPLDADDYWIDDKKLQKQVSCLEKYNELGFVYTNYYNEDELTGERWLGLPINHQYPDKDAFLLMLISPFINMSVPCFRSNLIDQELLETFVKLNFEAPDLAFFLDFTFRSKGFFLPEPAVVYTIRGGSMSHQTDFEKKILNYNRCFEIGNYYIQKHNIQEVVLEKRNFNFRLKLLLTAWETRDFNKVQQYAKPLAIQDFMSYNKKALYIYYASKYKMLFKLFKPWVLRKKTKTF
ncbi:MAG: glycosyltransferase [Niabella sp.]